MDLSFTDPTFYNQLPTNSINSTTLTLFKTKLKMPFSLRAFPLIFICYFMCSLSTCLSAIANVTCKSLLVFKVTWKTYTVVELSEISPFPAVGFSPDKSHLSSLLKQCFTWIPPSISIAKMVIETAADTLFAFNIHPNLHFIHICYKVCHSLDFHDLGLH